MLHFRGNRIGRQQYEKIDVAVTSCVATSLRAIQNGLSIRYKPMRHLPYLIYNIFSSHHSSSVLPAKISNNFRSAKFFCHTCSGGGIHTKDAAPAYERLFNSFL